MNLADTITSLFAQGTGADKHTAREAFAELRTLLGTGAVRAAEPDATAASGWRVNPWVKQGILLGFRFGDTIDVSADHGRWPFYDFFFHHTETPEIYTLSLHDALPI